MISVPYFEPSVEALNVVNWLLLGDQRACRAGGQGGHHIQLLALAGGEGKIVVLAGLLEL